MQFGLYLHPIWVSDARGWFIVGAHHLVSTPSKELKPSLAWLGIVSKDIAVIPLESFTEFIRYGQFLYLQYCTLLYVKNL